MDFFVNLLSYKSESTPAKLTKEKLLINFIALTSLFSLFYVFISYLIGFKIGLYVMLINFSLLYFTLFLFIKKIIRYHITVNIYLINCTFVAILLCTYFSGGLASPVLPWFILAPIISLLLFSAGKETLTWLIIISLLFLGFTIMSKAQYSFPIAYDLYWKDFFHFTCYAGLGLIVLLVTRIFEHTKERAFFQLEEKNKEIEAHKEELITSAETLQVANQQILASNQVLSQQKEKIEAQRDALNYEKELSEKLLLNILPYETAIELKEKGSATPRFYESVSVMFTDFVNFTGIAEKLPPEKLIAKLNSYFFAFDEIVEKHGLEKIKTIGDAYMCAGGIPVADKGNAIKAVAAALEIQGFMQKQKAIKIENNEPFWELRIGIHTGPIIAGVVGKNKFAFDIWGDTVNLASRMEAGSVAGRINISGDTYHLVKQHYSCSYRGKVEAKNKGEVNMYFVDFKLKKDKSIKAAM